MKKLATSILIAMCGGSVNAQMTVDFGLFPSQGNDTTLEVRLRPTENFDGVVGAIVFTVQWPAWSTDLLGTRILTCPDAMTVSPTPMVTADGFHTRTYTGFNTELLSDWGCALLADEERIIAFIPVHPSVNGLDQFRLCQPFISLTDPDNTGIVYSEPCLSLGVGEVPNGVADGLTLFPNPVTDEITITTPAGRPPATTIDLLVLDGRTLRLTDGRNGTFDLRGLAPGLYVVRAQGLLGRFMKR